MDIECTPYAEWLEECIKLIFEEKPVCIAMVATLDSGETMTGYYNASAQDKAVFVHHIQTDVTMDIVRANIDLVKNALEEECAD